MADGLLDKAKDLIQNNAGELLKNSDQVKKTVTEVGKKIAPDSLDDKVEGAVGSAVDFLKDKLGK